MTRLITEWISRPDDDVKKIDRKLKKVVGMDMTSLAFFAAGADTIRKDEMKLRRVAVIRVTTGEGLIGCFAETVAAVVRHMGASVFIPDASDVAGVYEAVTQGAEILFMADDDRFIALNVRTGKIAENDRATAKGYVSALSLMAGGLSGKDVLLLGFGRVGEIALEYLLEQGAKVSVFERDVSKTASLSRDRVKVLSSLPDLISGEVLDVTNEGGWLGVGDISDDVKFSTPGIPLSLDGEAYLAYYDNVIHDPLQTGVAVMLAMALDTGGGSDGSHRP